MKTDEMTLDAPTPESIIPDPKAFTCTPSSLLAASPCLACLSYRELYAVMVGILATALGKTPNQMINESACFACMVEKQMLQAVVSKLGNDLAPHQLDTVMAKVACLRTVPDSPLLAAFVYGLCKCTITKT
jgi:hypothetical protein